MDCRHPCRRGITLLELLLALALTGLVMIVISMAIDLHLRTLDVRRTSVEENQVARAVLKKISGDLRCVVVSVPIDMSGVQDMSGMDSLLGGDMSVLDSLGGDIPSDDTGGSSDPRSGDTGGGDTGGGESTADTGGDLAGDAGTDLLLEEGDTLTLNNVDIAGTVVPTNVPGLYGNQFELQVDVSRLPRVDQYEMMFAASSLGAAVDIPSDVKTVAYFLRSDDGNTPLTSGDWSVETGPGLMRREMDRAVTSWGSQSGELDTTSTDGELIAPEVNYLEFRYFDGLAWVTEWDSEEMGGLPMAVEITIGIDPTHGQDVSELDETELADLQMTDVNEYLYRLVVHLPVAQPTSADDSLLMGLEGDLGL